METLKSAKIPTLRVQPAMGEMAATTVMREPRKGKRVLSSTVEMCRSIKVLRTPGQRATDEELSAAARQFVRKITGFHKPSKASEAAFEQAIVEIAQTSRRVLEAVGVRSATTV